MAATYDIALFTGAGPSQNDTITLGVYRWADTNTDDSTSPIVRGGATVYSWAKSWKLRVVTAPATEVVNLRFFSAAANFGGSHTGAIFKAINQGTYAIGVVGDQTALRSSLVNHLVGSPLTVRAGRVADSGDSFPTTQGAGDDQDFLESQIEIDNTVPPGATPNQLQTYRIEET